MKFTAEFKGVKDGDIYHTTFQPGDECPKELESAARETGSLSADVESREEVKKAKAKK